MAFNVVHNPFNAPVNVAVAAVALESTVLISPISIQVDATGLSFLERADSDEIWALSILFTDGSEYILEAQGIDNRIFALGSDIREDNTIHRAKLTCMFNRIIDLDKVSAVKINGTELLIK